MTVKSKPARPKAKFSLVNSCASGRGCDDCPCCLDSVSGNVADSDLHPAGGEEQPDDPDTVMDAEGFHVAAEPNEGDAVAELLVPPPPVAPADPGLR